MNSDYIKQFSDLLDLFKYSSKDSGRKTEKNIQVLTDFERDLHKSVNSIPLKANAFSELYLCAFDFFLIRFLQKKSDKDFSSICNGLRIRIQQIIKVLTDSNILSSDLEDWFISKNPKLNNSDYQILKDKLTILQEGKLNLSERNFSQLIKGEKSKNLEESLFILVNILNSCMDSEICFPEKIMNFFKMVCFGSSEKELTELTNKTVLEYWKNYLELNGEYKTTFFERKENLEQISKKQRESYYPMFEFDEVKFFYIDDLLEIYEYNLAFNSDRNELEKICASYKLLLRIFKNKLIQFDSNATLPDYMLFLDTISPFIAEFQKYYGNGICLFQLLQYISYEKFCLIFNESSSPEQIQYNLGMIGMYYGILSNWKNYARSTFPNNADIRKLYSGYENQLLDAFKKSTQDILEQEQTGLRMRTSTYKILQSMMFFAVWNLCGSYQVDEYTISSKKEGIDKKYNIEKPFYDALKDGSWYGTEKQKEIYNHVAEEFNFNKNANNEPLFGNINYAELKNKKAVMNLLYNLSRSKIYSMETLMNQMNYTRSQQTRLLYIKWNKNGGYEDYDKANLLQQQLQMIDVGFQIQNYEQNIFPFNLPSIREICGNRMHFFRNITCKFCCETDNVIGKDNEGHKCIDWRETNKKGMFNRYLYKDRNIETHKGRHTAVENLLKPSNWKTLIYALEDFRKEIIEKKLEEENINHDYIYNSPRNDPIFFLLNILGTESTSLIRILRQKLCEAFNLTFKPYENLDCDREKFLDDFCSEVEQKIENQKFDIRKLSYKSPDKFDIRDEKKCNPDFLFEQRLEEYLNIIYSVNGSNEDGFTHNRSVKDFYSTYYSQIAFYLMYLTLKFEKIEEYKN